jgi:hypothetical protein
LQLNQKEIIMSVQNTPAISFDTFAKSIVGEYKKFDKAQTKLSTTVETTMQKFVDYVAVTIGRDKAACNALKKAVADSQVVIDTVALGIMEKKTFTEYAQSAQRALHYNVPYSAALKNDKEMTLPWSKAGAGSGVPTKAGTVTTTNRAELDKTICKVLAQARAIGQLGFAADLLDLCLDRLDGFKETVLK